MGREIRRVPEQWQHPKHRGDYKPLRSDYIEALEYSIEHLQDLKERLVELKNKGSVEVYGDTFTKERDLAEWSLEDFYVPQPKEFMPYGEWYQLYENVSEGTPITPSFKTKGELKEWLSNNEDFWGNKWSEASINSILKSGGAVSGIMTKGKIYQPHEQGDIDD